MNGLLAYKEFLKDSNSWVVYNSLPRLKIENLGKKIKLLHDICLTLSSVKGGQNYFKGIPNHLKAHIIGFLFPEGRDFNMPSKVYDGVLSRP